MAPSFDNLREDDDGYDSAEDLDFSGRLRSHPHNSFAQAEPVTTPQIYENNMTSGLNKA